uniref:Lipocalin/cytosolic fatty-acid binding domain-containing protein n=1 Tax=Spermophilus dauricus TaxID=99837 RepID=A0A8C9NZJ2_SPEDA
PFQLILTMGESHGLQGSPSSHLSLQISGVWYSISMASNNLSRIKEDGDLRIFIRNIEHLKNGSLKFNFRFMVQGECVGVSMVCQKTNKNGEYSISYEGENKVLVSETDYKMYVIFDMQNIRNGTETRVLALYVCRKYRLSSKNIMDLTQEGRAPASGQCRLPGPAAQGLGVWGEAQRANRGAFVSPDHCYSKR